MGLILKILDRPKCNKCSGSRAQFSFREMQYEPCRACDGDGKEPPTDFQIWLVNLLTYVAPMSFWRKL